MYQEIPKNGIFIVLGEVNYILTAMKRNLRYNHYDLSQDPLIKNFTDLKALLASSTSLSEIDSTTYLAPFLEVIKSEDTNGPITGISLSALDKFISYGLIDLNSESISTTVQQISDAVTHARFVGTDTSSDEVVLMRILHVLRSLTLSPIGIHLSNSCVCEIMQSCFQICFEARLGELLRKTAEVILIDMVQLLFARLPQFKEDLKASAIKKLTMKGNAYDASKQKKQKIKNNNTVKNIQTKNDGVLDRKDSEKGESETLQKTDIVEKSVEETQSTTDTSQIESEVKHDQIIEMNANDGEKMTFVDLSNKNPIDETKSNIDSDYVNPRGVRFVQESTNNSIIPYGLPCIRELLRFLISLINVKNTDIMIHMGLNLLIVALESGVDHISTFQSLLFYIKDDLCKSLFTLLASERIVLYSYSLRASFLLFESLRTHLKLQLEYFFTKLMEIIISETRSYDHKEIALDYIIQFLRIPGFPVELYINYDCCLSCSNLFEDLTKLLSKNAFPVQGLFTTNSLSLNSLLTVIENIELENTIQRNNIENNLNIDGFLKPVSSGFNAAQSFKYILTTENKANKPREPQTVSRMNRMKIAENLPTQDELKKNRIRKKLISQSVDIFNQSPSKGIQFLKDNNLIDTLNLDELVKFLKNIPTLDKKALGEYISNRKNVNVLEAFVKSFNFESIRIDEALRSFLETFRLPGEAPLISAILEHFARHWRNSNSHQFANDDAAFTLAYAIIMLNVDQHNHNVKKQSVPMVVEEFKKNLSKVNGNENFDDELLEEIYSAIRNDEIVMPAEQTGVVRENYLWKLLIRRSLHEDTQFMHIPAGSYNYDIFNIIWGQTVAALSFVYDKSLDHNNVIMQKCINGFKKCAQIAAGYMMSDVFDNIVISLCKFTTLLSISEAHDQIPIYFGMNQKAQLACKTVFQLTHSHGDMLRDGWKNILDCIVQLYYARLLPRVLIECEDFVNPTGRIYLLKEENQIIQKPEGSGLFSSLFPFISQDTSMSKGPTPEEQESIKMAQSCVDSCHIEQLIHDTKFLRIDSLIELTKALVFLSQSAEQHAHDNSPVKYDTDASIFCLELLIKVIIQNRDRISCIWLIIRNHFYNIIYNSSEYTFFLERAVVGLQRICIRLLRREELVNEVLSSLRMLLLIKHTIIRRMSKQISYGIHELLRTNASNITSADDWLTLFSLLKVIGAGALAPPIIISSVNHMEKIIIKSSDDNLQMTTSDDNLSTGDKLHKHDRLERGYTSDSEIYNNNSQANSLLNTANSIGDVSSQKRNDWIMVNKEDLDFMKSQQNLLNQYKIELDEGLNQHDKKSFMKCCETLTFLVRDLAYINKDNFESCINCLRVFVEACVSGENRLNKAKLNETKVTNKNRPIKTNQKINKQNSSHAISDDGKSVYGHVKVESEDDDDPLVTSYESLSIQLLDLLDILHNKASQIFTIDDSTNPDTNISILWTKCWCPILQGIARLSCDINGEVRMHALQYLQRALLVQDLQRLSAIEWESCFNKVLFPLLAKLLENIDPKNLVRMEETRMRASTLLCKVFLQHLTTLARLSTFTALWLTILDYMDKYMKSDKSDILRDVIPESLKNMLLVMDTTELFNLNNEIKNSQLCVITKDRIESFLPGLWDDLFKTTSTKPVAETNIESEKKIVDDVKFSCVDEKENYVTIENTNVEQNPTPVNKSQIDVKDL